MQTAGLFNQLLARLEMQVIGIGKNDLGAAILDLGRGHRFHGTMGADRHENRGFNCAVWSRDAPPSGACGFVGGDQFKIQHQKNCLYEKQSIIVGKIKVRGRSCLLHLCTIKDLTPLGDPLCMESEAFFERQLRRFFPERKKEVVNVGDNSYGIGGVLAVLRGILIISRPW